MSVAGAAQHARRAELAPPLLKLSGTLAQAIRNKFGVEPDRLRFYVHYQPSYVVLIEFVKCSQPDVAETHV